MVVVPAQSLAARDVDTSRRPAAPRGRRLRTPRASCAGARLDLTGRLARGGRPRLRRTSRRLLRRWHAASERGQDPPGGRFRTSVRWHAGRAKRAMTSLSRPAGRPASPRGGRASRAPCATRGRTARTAGAGATRPSSGRSRAAPPISSFERPSTTSRTTSSSRSLSRHERRPARPDRERQPAGGDAPDRVEQLGDRRGLEHEPRRAQAQRRLGVLRVVVRRSGR